MATKKQRTPEGDRTPLPSREGIGVLSAASRARDQLDRLRRVHATALGPGPEGELVIRSNVHAQRLAKSELDAAGALRDLHAAMSSRQEPFDVDRLLTLRDAMQAVNFPSDHWSIRLGARWLADYPYTAGTRFLRGASERLERAVVLLDLATDDAREAGPVATPVVADLPPLRSTLEERILAVLVAEDGTGLLSSAQVSDRIGVRFGAYDVDDRTIRAAIQRMRGAGYPIETSGRGSRIAPSMRDRLPPAFRG